MHCLVCPQKKKKNKLRGIWNRDKGKRSVRWQHLYLFCLKQPSLPRTRLCFQSPRRHQPRLLRDSPRLSQRSGWARKHDSRQLEWQRPEGTGTICFNTSNSSSSAHSCRRGRERYWTDQSGHEMKRGRWSGTRRSSLFPQTGDCGKKAVSKGSSLGTVSSLSPNSGSKWFNRNLRGQQGKERDFCCFQICDFCPSTRTRHPCGTQVTRKHNKQQVLSSKQGPLSRTCELLDWAGAESCLFFLRRGSERLLCQVSL